MPRWTAVKATTATTKETIMPNIYQDYCELEKFFGEQIFYKLDVETLSELSSDALFRLQALIMQTLAEKLKEKD